MTITKDIDRLFRKIREEKVTLFIGSGFSLSAGAPSANDLLSAIQRDCPDVYGGDLQSMSEDYMQRHDESKEELINLLHSVFPKQSKDDSCQKRLTRIPHFKKIFTTNYDSYIEDAYGEDKCRVLRKDVDIATIEHRAVDIYKLHGDFICPENIVITRSDYDGFLQRKKIPLMWAQLQSAMADSHIVFIGYSIDDQNIFNLIKEVELACSGFQKEMFLITPTAESYKLDRLRKHNITWISATAEDFLSALETNIQDNIFKDHRHKKVSPDTFIRYCQIHDINPSIEVHDDVNCVTNVKGYNGHQLKGDVKFTVHGTENPFDKIATIAKDGPLKGKPGVVIPAKDLISFSYRLNDILVTELADITNLYISPITKTHHVTVRIPSRDFIETIDCTGFRSGENAFTFSFDLGISMFTLELRSEAPSNTTIHNEMNEQYSSNSDALCWVEFLDALCSGEEVIFQISEPAVMFALKLPSEHLDTQLFKPYRDYYKRVRRIESLSMIKFSCYYNWSKERDDMAIRLLHWLEHDDFNHITSPSGLKFSVDFLDEDASDFIDGTQSVKTWEVLYGVPMSDIYFNEHQFTIPYRYIKYVNSRIIKTQRLKSGILRVYFHDDAPVFKEILSPHQLLPEGEVRLDPKRNQQPRV